MKDKLLYFLIPVSMCLVLAFYFYNPSGTYSYDPRLRIIGYSLFSIPSASNKPTINPGDTVVVSSYAYMGRLPKLNDFAVFVPPKSESPFVKRVVGLPGDVVEISNSEIFINGSHGVVFEPENQFRKSPRSRFFKRITVPKEHFFVIGDNWDNSLDSRHFGAVHASKLFGKVIKVF